MPNYLQQARAGFRPQQHQMPQTAPYKGFSQWSPPPTMNLPYKGNTPEQLGNVLNSYLKAKEYKAQNKLAEFQMQQAKSAAEQQKAAQEQQLAQQQALQKVFAEYGDPNIAAVGKYNPQVGFQLIEMKKNLNKVDYSEIENKVEYAAAVDRAASGGIETYPALQELVGQLRGVEFDQQKVDMVLQRNKPYLAAFQDLQVAKNKPKYTIVNKDGSTQAVVATTTAQKNKYDAMVKEGKAKLGEYKAGAKPTTDRRERDIQWYMDNKQMNRAQAQDQVNADEAKLSAAKQKPTEKQKSIDALIRTAMTNDPALTKDAARAIADRKYAELYRTSNIVNIDNAGNEIYTEKELGKFTEALFDSKVLGDVISYNLYANILSRQLGIDIPPMDVLQSSSIGELGERIKLGILRMGDRQIDKVFGGETSPEEQLAPAPVSSDPVDAFIRDNK